MLAETARLVVDEGLSVERALDRAAARLGVRLSQSRPTREQVHEAIREHRSLFRPRQYVQLADQRRRALESMRQLAIHQPRLIGGLVTGDGPFDRITLLLQADTIEQVIHDLQDRHIPWRSMDSTLQHARGQLVSHPGVRFEAGTSTIELIVPSRPLRSNPPRDPVDGKALPMLTTEQLAALLADEEDSNQRSSAGT